MSNSPISSRVALETSVGGGANRPPDVARSGRAILPSYATGGTQSITASEVVTIPLSVGAMTSMATASVSGMAGLTTSRNVKLAPYDTAQFILSHPTIPQVPNAIVSAPTIQVTTAQGVPVGGVLAPGQAYTQCAISVTANVFATATVAPTTVNVIVTASLVGSVTGQ